MSSAQVLFTGPVSSLLSSCEYWPLTVHSCPILLKIKRVEVCCLIGKYLEGYTLTFPHCALRKVSCFLNTGMPQTVSLGENQASLEKSRTPEVQFHKRPWRPNCLPLCIWKKQLLGVYRVPGTELLLSTRSCSEHTDRNNVIFPPYCKTHSLMVDTDYCFLILQSIFKMQCRNV